MKHLADYSMVAWCQIMLQSVHAVTPLSIITISFDLVSAELLYTPYDASSLKLWRCRGMSVLIKQAVNKTHRHHIYCLGFEWLISLFLKLLYVLRGILCSNYIVPGLEFKLFSDNCFAEANTLQSVSSILSLSPLRLLPKHLKLCSSHWN